MTLTELRYAVALANEGSFSRAAERCAVSQPTLSVSIARLEGKLNVSIFERGKGAVSVTALGEQIIEQARRTLREADRVKQIAQSGRDQLNGVLNLGVIHTIAPYLLPELVHNLREVAPQMPLAIEENMTVHLSALLRDNVIDAAIVALPFVENSILTRPLYDESFKLIVPINHPWAERSEISSEEIDGVEMLLLKAGNCFRDQVLESCPHLSLPEGDFRLGHSIETIRQMVASGLGVSVLPASAVNSEYHNNLIKVIPFKPPVPIRRVVLAWRPAFVRPRAIEALFEAVRRMKNPDLRLLA